MANGRLTFHRRRTWQGYARSYKIIVDGVEVGALRAGGTPAVDVAEGLHVLEARISWTGSKKTDVLVPASGEVRVEVSPAGDLGKGLIDRAASTDEYLALTVEGSAAP